MCGCCTSGFQGRRPHRYLGAVQPDRGTCFAFESSSGLHIALKVCAWNLQGDVTIELFVMFEEYRTHSSQTQLTDDSISSHLLRNPHRLTGKQVFRIVRVQVIQGAIVSRLASEWSALNCSKTRFAVSTSAGTYPSSQAAKNQPVLTHVTSNCLVIVSAGNPSQSAGNYVDRGSARPQKTFVFLH